MAESVTEYGEVRTQRASKQEDRSFRACIPTLRRKAQRAAAGREKIQWQSRVRRILCLGSELERCSLRGASVVCVLHVRIKDVRYHRVPAGMDQTAVGRAARLRPERVEGRGNMDLLAK